jgi:hypothetical protein
MTFTHLIICNCSQRRRLRVTHGGVTWSTVREGRSASVTREVRQEMSGKRVVTGKGDKTVHVVASKGFSLWHLIWMHL